MSHHHVVGRTSIVVEQGLRLLHPQLPSESIDPASRVPSRDRAEWLAQLTEATHIAGRGGAAFPFATKLRAAAGAKGRPIVVVNASEGEPASFKDAALALTRPQLILDGAAVTALALGARTVHVVLPGESPEVGDSLRQAAAVRDDKLHWRFATAGAHFVAGQASAVIELLSGRPNLPVTALKPPAIEGLKGRPTFLSNAETFAHVAMAVVQGALRFAEHGTDDEPGTTLLTVHDGPRPRVVEVAYGTPWLDVLDGATLYRPILVGGYHGRWASDGQLAGLTVSRRDLASVGVGLGAGVVLPVRPGECPLDVTAKILSYLAGESARRCGPCRNGLPALAEAFSAVALGRGSSDAVAHLTHLVAGRGACAHPDGTARLADSALAVFGDEIAAHASGRCLVRRAS